MRATELGTEAGVGACIMMRLFRGAFGIEVFANVVLPWVAYVLAQPGMGRVHALMVSAAPPIAWSAIHFWRTRRIDAFSILVIAGIGLSVLAFFGGGSFRVLELREHLVSGVMGLVFIGSVVIGRPVLAAVLRSIMERKSQAEAEGLRSGFGDRRRLMLLTLSVGLLLLIQTGVAISLVFTLPVREFLILSPILNYVLIGLFAGVVLYNRSRARAASAEVEHGQDESVP